MPLITNKGLIFRQLFDRQSCTYTYLIACSQTRETILIDPVKELVERDLNLVRELELKLRYVINTHVHADHATGSGLIKSKFEPGTVQSIISKSSGAKADIYVTDGDTINCGENFQLKVLGTPGHTSGCLSFFCNNADTPFVLTGDALLIRGCGRTDFQQGNSGQLFDSIQTKLFTLPDECLVFPAHDYKGNLCSTIGEEKRFNPRLPKSRQEFIELMDNLNLQLPKLIDIVVPQNMRCGL